jgi:hypothetical protein
MENKKELQALELQALKEVPDCVEMEGLDGTFEHVVFRVEHVVLIFEEGENWYTKLEASRCKKWLKKFAPESKYA